MRTELIISPGKRRLLVIPETEVEVLLLKAFHEVKSSSVAKTTLLGNNIDNALMLEADEKPIITSANRSVDESTGTIRS